MVLFFAPKYEFVEGTKNQRMYVYALLKFQAALLILHNHKTRVCVSLFVCVSDQACPSSHSETAMKVMYIQ